MEIDPVTIVASAHFATKNKIISCVSLHYLVPKKTVLQRLSVHKSNSGKPDAEDIVSNKGLPDEQIYYITNWIMTPTDGVIFRFR